MWTRHMAELLHVEAQGASKGPWPSNITTHDPITPEEQKWPGDDVHPLCPCPVG